MNTVYTVSQVTFYIKQLLENNNVLSHFEVSGEISNLTYHRSGHVYFSIKDRETQLSCVMWKSHAQTAERMTEGERVVLMGKISLYAPRGAYQMMVMKVKKEGLGNLYQQFLLLKEKLQKQGLFDEINKKLIPAFPQKIALITSATGAARRDIEQTINRRFRALQLVLIPATVQGAGGKQSIVNALKRADTISADLILLARGGGSIEDLWCFNEEAVARAIADCKTPVLAGIGHETDFTIADFVADKRASTPTAAAELAVPDQAVITKELQTMLANMERNLQHFIGFKRQLLDDYAQRLEGNLISSVQEKKHQLKMKETDMIYSFQQHLQFKRQILDNYDQRMQQHIKDSIRMRRHGLELLKSQLQATDRNLILKQGYTLTLQEGKIMKSAQGLAKGDQIETIFEDGRKKSTID